MSKAKAQDSNDTNCVVCCRKVLIYSIGECDHPVCYECATRMKVLCRQNECPICRRDLPKVYFIRNRKQYSEVRHGIFSYYDRKFKIYFEDADVQQAYQTLLEHRCKLCKTRPTFNSFGSLKDHVRKDHELHFCELCVEHLRIFTHERKFYNRSELARHRRIGDLDDRSHRGHPLCEFCDERYLDSDELFRHLRKEHFFCHFCDADGLHHYYSDYEYLREHFRVEHYLCEEDDCKHEKFTTAFRTEIDLKAHRATEHHRGLSKAQVKQARTLELEFTIAPRATGTGNGPDDLDSSRRGRRGGYRGSNYTHPYYSRSDEPTLVDHTPVVQSSTVQQPTANLDMNSCFEFPTLGTEAESESSSKTESQSQGATANSASVAAKNRHDGGLIGDTLAQKLAKLNRFSVGNHSSRGEEDFPALGNGKNNVTVPSTSSWASASGSTTLSLTSSQAPVSNPSGVKKTLTLKLNSQEDFPGLENSKKKRQQPSSVSIQVGGRLKSASTTPTGNGSDNAKQQPVVTRLSSSQNITFLNTAASSSPTNPSASKLSDTPTTYTEIFPKTDSGWYVLKKSNKKVSDDASSRKGSSDFTVADDFPALESGKPIRGMRQATESSSVTIPINNAWKSQPDEKNGEATATKATKSSKKKKQKTPSLSSELTTKATGVTKASKSAEGGTTKRTELKIESLASPTSNGEAVPVMSSFTMEDFPRLTSAPPPPGFGDVKPMSVPPPGFATVTVQPPPGFAGLNNNSSTNGSTVMFTNSCGQNFALETPSPMIYHTYLQPEEFAHRNQELLRKLREALEAGDDDSDVKETEKFNEFKTISTSFRRGAITATEYYDKCLPLIGREKFADIFPELLVLLPDINRQQELLAVYNEKNANDKKTKQFLICAACQQVLSIKDFRAHENKHQIQLLELDFPSLGHDNNNSIQKTVLNPSGTAWINRSNDN